MMLRTRNIRVLVVDDHEMVRRSLAVFAQIYDDIEIVGAATNGDEAMRLCADLRPDIMLLDLNIPRIDGLSVARVMRQLYPAVQVVVLTHSNAAEDIAAAKQAGVSGYVLKDQGGEEIAKAIRAVAQRPLIAR